MQGFEQPLRRSQSNSGKLPARFRRKEISIAGANVRSRRNAGAASQHHLPAHEFAVVLSQRSSQWSKARIAKISARSPLPAVAKKLRGVFRCQLRYSRNRLQPAAFQKISLDRSQRTRRPFSAFLVLKEDNTTGFEFAPRAPKDPNAPKGRRGKKKPAADAAPAADASPAAGAPASE